MTVQTAALGFLWGNLAACALAAVVILLPRFERMIAALALPVFCLPLVATGSILRFLFGSGDGPQIVLAALAVYYTTSLALLVDLRAVPQSWFDLVTPHGLGRLAKLFHVRAVASLPYAVPGLRIAVPAAFLGAMIGESTGAERGLAVLTIHPGDARARRRRDMDGREPRRRRLHRRLCGARPARPPVCRNAPALLLSAPGRQQPATPLRRLLGFAQLILVLALRRGATGAIAIVAVMMFFPTLVACLQGLRQAPEQVIDIFDSYAVGR